MVDFYFIPAILLGALLNRFNSIRHRVIVLCLITLTVVLYQLKNFQIRKGILDEFCTYKEIFWRNFFRIKKANMFLVPPSSILRQNVSVQDFESAAFSGNRTGNNKYSGNYSLLLDPANYICRISEHRFPDFFTEKGNKKIRVSFWCYFEKDVKQVHVFLQFMDKEGKMIQEVPYYLGEESIYHDSWDYKEFGMDLADQQALSVNSVEKVVLTIWNVDAKHNVYIDDAKVEFMLTDTSFETVK